MRESTAGVLVAGHQDNRAAQADFEKLVSMIERGEVKGVVFPAEATEGPPSSGSGSVRKGAMWGAGAGFLAGLVPLVASTIIAAGAGAFIAKAAQVRVHPGSAPSIRFGRERR